MVRCVQSLRALISRLPQDIDTSEIRSELDAAATASEASSTDAKRRRAITEWIYGQVVLCLQDTAQHFLSGIENEDTASSLRTYLQALIKDSDRMIAFFTDQKIVSILTTSAGKTSTPLETPTYTPGDALRKTHKFGSKFSYVSVYYSPKDIEAWVAAYKIFKKSQLLPNHLVAAHECAKKHLDEEAATANIPRHFCDNFALIVPWLEKRGLKLHLVRFAYVTTGFLESYRALQNGGDEDISDVKHHAALALAIIEKHIRAPDMRTVSMQTYNIYVGVIGDPPTIDRIEVFQRLLKIERLTAAPKELEQEKKRKAGVEPLVGLEALNSFRERIPKSKRTDPGGKHKIMEL
jgi:hypothetical protein